MKEITKCEVCGSANLASVLDLGMHPLCDDLIKIGKSQKQNFYPIEILLCHTCQSAHQRFQINKCELFPREYHYRSAQTNDVLRGMGEFVASIKESYGALKGTKILDIGCNDGSLLDIFKAQGAETFGLEPTNAYKIARKKHKIINAYFDTKSAEMLRGVDFSFITFSNVFAHIDDLNALCEGLKSLLSPRTKIIIENHYLGAILNKMQFDTFYHEHPRTYSFRSFVFIAQKLGLNVEKVEFPRRYGGNIRVILGNGNPCAISESEGDFSAKFDAMREFIAKWRIEKRREILALCEKFGKLSAKAFPGRGAILLKMLVLNENHIEAIYEKQGSPKIGFYAPATRIPILCDELLFTKNRPIIINIAWHIKREIEAYLRENAKKNGVEFGKIVHLL